MNNMITNLVAQGYQTESATDTSARLVKKKKMSIAGLIILLLLGIIFGIIYLAVCLTREPQDDVLITVRQPAYQQQGYGYPPQQGNPYPYGQNGNPQNK